MLIRRLPDRYTQRSKHRALAARLSLHFFSRYIDRRQVLETGKKPPGLGGTTPSRRAWESYLSRLDCQNPILIAQRFLDQARLPSVRTMAQVAEHFGVSRAMVSYHIALVTRLPRGFIDWLRQCEDPDILSYFTERRLRPVTRVVDKDQQSAMLDEMISSARSRTQE
jgi:hypothetical protein